MKWFMLVKIVEGIIVYTIIVGYGPNEDSTVESKNKFWEDVTNVIDRSDGIKIIIGDLNARVCLDFCTE